MTDAFAPVAFFACGGASGKSIESIAYLSDGVEHGEAKVSAATLHLSVSAIADNAARACLAGRNATNHLGAILDRLLAVEGALLAGEALADDLGVLIDHHVGLSGVARCSRNGAAHGHGCRSALGAHGARGTAQHLATRSVTPVLRVRTHLLAREAPTKGGATGPNTFRTFRTWVMSVVAGVADLVFSRDERFVGWFANSARGARMSADDFYLRY